VTSPQPWKLDANGLLLYCQLQPGAKKDRFCGLFNNRVKISVCAPPVDGKANQALVRFLAKQLGARRQSIEVRQGRASRNKTLHIKGVTHVPEILQSILPGVS
jgi:hypothetical protein